MIDRDHPLSVARQAKLLDISRGAVYYQPRPASDADLALMRRIDELHLEHPFMGARMLRRMLARQGIFVGRRHLGTLMLRMGIQALCPQPGTSQRHRQHKVYPYLLRKVVISRANQVWALDTTYIPMARGFVYQHDETEVMNVVSAVAAQHGRTPIARVHDAIFFKRKINVDLRSEIEMCMQEHTNNQYWRLSHKQLER
jgi:putative transposase